MIYRAQSAQLVNSKSPFCGFFGFDPELSEGVKLGGDQIVGNGLVKCQPDVTHQQGDGVLPDALAGEVGFEVSEESRCDLVEGDPFVAVRYLIIGVEEQLRRLYCTSPLALVNPLPDHTLESNLPGSSLSKHPPEPGGSHTGKSPRKPDRTLDIPGHLQLHGSVDLIRCSMTNNHPGPELLRLHLKACNQVNPHTTTRGHHLHVYQSVFVLSLRPDYHLKLHHF